MGVNICTNDKGNDVEKRHPSLFRQKLLRKGESKRRCNPADFHDRHETSSHGRTDLVPGSSTSNYGHRSKIDGVLNWSYLKDISKEDFMSQT